MLEVSVHKGRIFGNIELLMMVTNDEEIGVRDDFDVGLDIQKVLYLCENIGECGA